MTCVQPRILAERLSLCYRRDIIRHLSDARNPGRLAHLRHLSVCARTLALPPPADSGASFLLCLLFCLLLLLYVSPPPPLPHFQTLLHFTLLLCTVWVQLRVNKSSCASLFFLFLHITPHALLPFIYSSIFVDSVFLWFSRFASFFPTVIPLFSRLLFPTSLPLFRFLSCATPVFSRTPLLPLPFSFFFLSIFLSLPLKCYLFPSLTSLLCSLMSELHKDDL